MYKQGMEEAVARVMGRYELLDRLAIGGMAELYKARVSGTHGFEKLVVIKKILPHLAADPSFVAMFIDEARITAKLEHPKIVQVFELGTSKEELFIALQYIEGTDLLALMRDTARRDTGVEPHIAAYIAHEVLDALDYAHTKTDQDGAPLGIVHRDVSPGNVLISLRGDIKLTDFGIAHAIERQHKTEAGTLKGKYGYMSPEQVLGEEVDARSDVFAVGTLLAEMLMGRRLFSASSDLDVLLMVRDGKIDRFFEHGADTPPPLAAIVSTALQRDARKRYPSAAAFREVLADWLHEERARIAPRDVASFIEAVAAMEPTQSDGVVAEMQDHVGTLSGPRTKMSQEAADVSASLGRAAYLGRAATPPPDFVIDDASSVISIEDEPKSAGAYANPRELGEFKTTSPFALLHTVSAERRTGLLFLEGRAGMLKEIYFIDGDPVFVASNVASERFGEYLVAREVITRKQLERAVAVLSHFSGRLADTLVGLDILKPLDAFRLAAQQVTDKIVDVCLWKKGKYRWFDNRQNERRVRPLHLETYRVLGIACLRIPETTIDEWYASQKTRRPKILDGADLGAFALGTASLRVAAMLTGADTLAAMSERLRADEARLNFLRIVYLFDQCGCLIA